MKDEMVKNIYDLFRLNNLRVVYCPNDELGLSGPFKEVDENEITEILLRKNTVEVLITENEKFDVMISRGLF